MKKIFTSFFVVALFLSFAVSVYGQNVTRNQAELNKVMPTVEQMRAWKHKVYTAPQGTEALELYSNGPLWNDDTPPAPIPAGAYGSELNSVALYSTLGGGWQFTAGNSLADDFTSGAAWNIDSLVFYGYQTGSGTTSTYNAIYVQIWNGPPDDAGSAVVWGDLTTNVMAYTHFTNVYRYSDTSPGTTRPIMAVVVTPAGLNLPAGTYWVQITAAGTGASGPWNPPIAYMGAPYNGNAKQLTTTGWVQYMDTGASDNLEVPFKIYGTSGAPVGPGPATDPSPANGAMGLDISGITLSWTNSAPTTAVDLYFSSDLALVQGLDPSVRVSTGTLISSYPLGDLTYSTPYYWRVVGSDGTGSTTNPVWNFRTMRDPTNWFEDFEAGLGSWTVTNTGSAGSCVWEIDVVSNSDYTMPPAAAGNVAAANSDDCGSTGVYPMSTWLTLNTPVNLSMYGDAVLEFDMDFNQYGVDTGLVEISPDGGATWEQLANFTVDTRAVHQMYDVTSIAAGQSEVLLRFYFFADDWNYAFAIDNVTLYGTQIIPVELTSFTVAATNGDVVLNWATATETNNSGFSIERRTETGVFAAVGFVEGHGTSTEMQRYTFNDAQVPAGNYTYRLKQVDFDGTYAYSEEVNVVIGTPTEFALDQNFPNPFNPSTTINFALASDSKVTLKVFNTLGEEVATLVNKDLAAGAHTVSFDASSLNSGVYFYRLEATGSNGKNFTDVKKMILMK